MVVVGILAAVWFLYCRGELYKIRIKTLLCSAMIMLLCMAGGSRVVFVISQLPIAIAVSDPWWIWNSLLTGGFVFYGGLFGAIFGAWLSGKILKQPSSEFLNYLIPAFPVFHFFGRIGCFLAGCCYGVPSELFGIIQPEIDTLPRLPVPLFESIYNLVIVAVLLWLEARARGRGKTPRLMQVYLLMYAPFRFVNEFFRGDDVRGFFGPLSTSQWISLITLAVLLTVYVVERVRGRSAEKITATDQQ